MTADGADPAADGVAGPGQTPAAAPLGAQTLRCRTVAGGGFQQLNYVRNLPPIAVEERLALPDGEEAATPAETLLAALGSCLTARIRANAVAGGAKIRSLALDVEADISASSMWGPVGGTPVAAGFNAIRVRVHLDADATPERLRTMIQHALIWSPVASTIHDGVTLDVALAELPAASPNGRDDP